MPINNFTSNCWGFCLSVLWPHLDLLRMLFGCGRMRTERARLLILETLMRFYHAASAALFYGRAFLGHCVILCALEVGSEYKLNTEVMEPSKV